MDPIAKRRAFLSTIRDNARDVQGDQLRAKYGAALSPNEEEALEGERPDPVGEASPLTDEELQHLLRAAQE